ncbi:MAG TPA: molybdopterin adenylyltransferase [Deltaproteobacteria bacterium]|nr:molybdopterin adenylyltransferase [Deltaproteobacteria bacterium]
MADTLKVGIVTLSDRASRGEYTDRGGPKVEELLRRFLESSWEAVKKILPDDEKLLEDTLRSLSDDEGCQLIITTGGTGPAPRDVTPDATLRVCQKILPGFGELMRAISYKKVPTAILSRQTAGIYNNKTLIVNLPGKPAAIEDCLPAIFPAVVDCLDLLGVKGVEVNRAEVSVHRPHRED